MVIQESHIREAEKILINGNRFDEDERIPFIKNLNSCDLLAVPGSGKTTSLLAKLYCISKHLPFSNGSGILVLSHTNAAVNEMEKVLKMHCPNLFNYPNFIGTIQSFVNKFLANPICIEKYGSYITINDNDIYENEAKKFFSSLSWSKKGVEPKNLKNKLFGLVNAAQKVNFTDGCAKILDFLKWFEFDINKRKIIFNNRTILKYDSQNRDYYLMVEDWKIKQLSKGLLNYYDSYNLANLYIDIYPEILNILQKRFNFIFIDEMQDLEKFQIDLIDKIFISDRSTSVLQRIGDINQSIYSSGKRVKVEVDWTPRNQSYLTGSNRLTSEIANVVNYFTLDRQVDEGGTPRFVVNGQRSEENPIEPHMILFDNDSKNKLEGKFKEIIVSFSLQETREAKKYGFKIIGWNAKWNDNLDHSGKLRLENIFESYNKEVKSNRDTYDSLSKYIQLFDHEKNTLEAARKAVLNALIHVLRIEGKTYIVKIRGGNVSRYFSKDEMIKFIKKPENNCDYEYFKTLVYVCASRLVLKKQYSVVFKFLKRFIEKKFKEWFNLTITQVTQSFIGNEFDKIIIEDNDTVVENFNDEIEIEIGTVHSAKGQTHCATMYVETAYQRPTYESEKVIKRNSNPFLLQEHQCTGTYDRQALKMMYVGFSRPTHLLCFACLKENIEGEIANYQASGWEIIDLTIDD